MVTRMINIGNALIFADEAAFQGSNGLLSMFSNTNGTGLPILDSSLTAITQALQIPVIILLIAFLPVSLIKEMIYSIYDAESAEDIKNVVNNADIQKSQKRILSELAESEHLGKKSRETLARRLIDNEEDKIAQNLNKTDIVTKIGPTLGLMGTLIPMGPGLAALGTGDVTTLASAITIAFNTTVIGIGSGAIAYFASKLRRRWFGEYLANLDALMDAILDNIDKRDERLK